MKLYCMCHEKNNKSESQAFGAPNIYGPYDDKTEFRMVVLKTPMWIVKNGVKQVILYKDKINDWTEKSYVSPKDIDHEHYPHVDFYECRNCGARVCKE